MFFWLKIHKDSIMLVCEILHSWKFKIYSYSFFRCVWRCASLFSKEQYEYEYLKCTTMYSLSINLYSPFIQLQAQPEFLGYLRPCMHTVQIHTTQLMQILYYISFRNMYNIIYKKLYCVHEYKFTEYIHSRFLCTRLYTKSIPSTRGIVNDLYIILNQNDPQSEVRY